MRDTLRSMDAQLKICFVFLILWGLLMASMTPAVADEIEYRTAKMKYDRFSSIELAALVKQAKRAAPHLPSQPGPASQ